ncbi:unnamed protein product [Gongylonema pulchrum]|uniref:CNH domain-containing protein n=1 Tax=Gongylonema pulchrum TaxID=637853 RepID=A0A183E9H9_9BILA|nr:unnamed protein product [Gongylonema pulchrum]
MSLFHVHDWLTVQLDDNAIVCAIGKLIEDRDQIIVGSIAGRLWVIDPGRVSDTKQQQQQQQLSCLLEEQLPYAVIDIAVANFITSLEQNLIAILSPQKLVISRLVSAYNMCIGSFGRASGTQICVQNLKCSFLVVEGEHQLFHRSVTTTDALHPGPIVYAQHSDSIVAASSSCVLASYKYSTLATASSGSYGKKISVCSFSNFYWAAFLICT